MSGIIVTSEPVRDRIVALTRSMSGATSSISRPIEGTDGLSKGTMTAKRRAPEEGTNEHRNAMVRRQVHRVTRRPREIGTGDRVRRRALRELVRTNDPVLVSAIEALLNGADIPHVVLDRNMSVIEGSLGILPRRILVADEQLAAARKLLVDAGLGHELRPDAR